MLVKGSEGRDAPAHPDRRGRGSRRRRQGRGRAQGRCEGASERARFDAHLDREHGRGREQGVPQEPRDQRRRLSRREVRRTAELEPGVTRTRSRSSRRTASRSRSRDRPRFTSTGSTNRPSAKSPRRFAGCANPNRTRAKASVTKASEFVRSSARPERQRRNNAIRRKRGARDTSACAKKLSGTPAASAPLRAPLAPSHLRHSGRRREGAHARVRVDARPFAGGGFVAYEPRCRQGRRQRRSPPRRKPPVSRASSSIGAATSITAACAHLRMRRVKRDWSSDAISWS